MIDDKHTYISVVSMVSLSVVVSWNDTHTTCNNMYIDGCINLIVEIYVCIPQDYDTFQVVKLEIYEFFDEIP